MNAELIDLIIPIATPILVYGLKKLWLRMPKLWIPVIAGALGPLQDLLLSYSLGNAPNPLLAIALGLAGVGLREIQDQAKQAGQANTKPRSKLP